VRYLLDECLSGMAAQAMTVLAPSAEFIHLLDVAAMSTADPDIPAICKEGAFDVLVSINVKDFGARKHIYESVILAGIHVLVLRRQPRQPTDLWWQASLLARHYPKYSKVFRNASEATLASMSDSGVRELTFAEIMLEIAAQESGRPPLP
jgi:hypothetical protein